MGKPSALTHESSFHLIILTKTTDVFYIENETIISQTKIQTLFEELISPFFHWSPNWIRY